MAVVDEDRSRGRAPAPHLHRRVGDGHGRGERWSSIAANLSCMAGVRRTSGLQPGRHGPVDTHAVRPIERPRLGHAQAVLRPGHPRLGTGEPGVDELEQVPGHARREADEGRGAATEPESPAPLPPNHRDRTPPLSPVHPAAAPGQRPLRGRALASQRERITMPSPVEEPENGPRTCAAAVDEAGPAPPLSRPTAWEPAGPSSGSVPSQHERRRRREPGQGQDHQQVPRLRLYCAGVVRTRPRPAVEGRLGAAGRRLRHELGRRSQGGQAAGRHRRRRSRG